MGTGLEHTRVPGARLWLKHWAGAPLILAYLSGPAFGREVDGILGADVLMRWDAVKIDYKNGKLVLDGMSPDP